MRFFSMASVTHLAVFELVIDSKLGACNLVCLKTGDLVSVSEVRSRASAR